MQISPKKFEQSHIPRVNGIIIHIYDSIISFYNNLVNISDR